MIKLVLERLFDQFWSQEAGHALHPFTQQLAKYKSASNASRDFSRFARLPLEACLPMVS